MPHGSITANCIEKKKQLNILLAEEMSKESGRTPFQERELLDRVSCQIVQCGATTGAIDPESQQYAEMIENLWDLYPKQMAVLAAASGVMTFENGQPVYSYTRMDQVFDNDVPIEAPGLVFGLATGGATGLLKVASKELAVLGKVIVRNMLDNPAAIGASGKTIAPNVADAAKQAMQRLRWNNVPPASKPQAVDTKLSNLIDNVYKGASNPNRVGDGSLADAVRYELG